MFILVYARILTLMNVGNVDFVKMMAFLRVKDCVGEEKKEEEKNKQ